MYAEEENRAIRSGGFTASMSIAITPSNACSTSLPDPGFRRAFAGKARPYHNSVLIVLFDQSEFWLLEAGLRQRYAAAHCDMVRNMWIAVGN